jgi:site-specific DNA-methyltransferase (adenine-specific)
MFPVTTSSQPSANGQYGNGKGKGANGVSVFGSGFNSSTPNRAPIGDSGSAARFFYSAKASKADRDEGMEGWEEATPGQRTGGRAEGSAGINAYAGTRGPARNVHPTVKPTDLMRYLVRLVTPPGGLVLDPFTGSGSTGKAAVLEGMRFIGCELSPEYAAIAEARIKAAAVKTGQIFELPASPAPGRKAEGEQLRLFA